MAYVHFTTLRSTKYAARHCAECVACNACPAASTCCIACYCQSLQQCTEWCCAAHRQVHLERQHVAARPSRHEHLLTSLSCALQHDHLASRWQAVVLLNFTYPHCGWHRCEDQHTMVASWRISVPELPDVWLTSHCELPDGQLATTQAQAD